MRNTKLFTLLAHTILIVLGTVTVAQIVILICLSFKNVFQASTQPVLPTFPMHPENYKTAWNYGVSKYLLNSLTLTSAIVLGSTLFSSIVAYVFARYAFPAKNIIFILVLSLTMIPFILIMVPLYTLIRDLKLMDTFWAYILPWVFGANSLAIVILRSSFSAIPEELFESARLDGAGHMALFFHIAVPLNWPSISAMAILIATSVWNDYFWPNLILRSDAVKPMAVGLLALASGRQAQGVGVLMAGSVIAAIPMVILFVFAMQAFIRGLTAGAVKI